MLSEVTTTIKDGQLGLLPPATDNIHLKIGVSSAGPLNTIVSISDKETLVSTFGTGPLVEAVAIALDIAGGPILVCRTNASVAGTVSIVATVGSGPAVTTTSTVPLDAYEVIVKIILGGAVATATFQYSLDGGDNWSPVIATAATYAIPGTGIMLNFAAGTYVVDTTYSFTTVAPSYVLADLQASMDAAHNSGREFGFYHVVGFITPAIATGIDAKLAAQEVLFRYSWALIEARDYNAETDAVWSAALITEYAAFASVRVSISAGVCELTSPITGRLHRRPAGWLAAARAAQVPIQEELSRVARGPLPGITKLYHDEFVNQGLDAAKFLTLRTIIGRQGFYISSGNIKCANGSDFTLIPRRRVMDRACKVTRDKLLTWLNETLLVNADGTIQEGEAQSIEQQVKAALEADVVSRGAASAVDCVVDRTVNLVSTGNLKVTTTVTPVGYARSISQSIGFKTPNLSLKVA